jgi:hypothetical protein
VGEHAEGRYFGHMPAYMLRARFGAHRWDEMFTFGFVRNPWDRLVSIAARINRPALAGKDTFRVWMANGCQDDTGSTHNAAGGMPVHRPCSDFVFPCKFVGRYEALDTDTRYICRVLGIDMPEWLHDEKCERGPYQDYYDEEGRQFVEWYYHTDIVNFGYSF